MTNVQRLRLNLSPRSQGILLLCRGRLQAQTREADAPAAAATFDRARAVAVDA
jgi:hypothetical protein